MEKFDTDRYYLGTLCIRGHDFSGKEESPRYVRNGRCVYCFRESRGYNSKGLGWVKSDGFSEKRVKKEVEKSGYKYIGPYKNFTTNFLVLCSGCNNPWNARLDHIRKGGQCAACRVRNSRKQYDVHCSYCKKLFKEYKSKLEHVKNHYCGNICRIKGQRGQAVAAFKHGESRTNLYSRKFKQKSTYWKEVIKWAKALPEQQKNDLMEIIEAWLNWKILILDTQQMLFKEKLL